MREADPYQVTFDSQGNVLCFGKIHGQRVELGEIEAVLTHDKRVAVITIFNPSVNQTQLTAFFEFEVISTQTSGGTGTPPSSPVANLVDILLY